MPNLKGTRTEKNLLTAFAGESQARNRYNYFASKAKNEGFEQIAAVFAETADNEKEHAKRFFKFLEGGEVSITATFPAGVIGTTAENLLEAANGEKHEHSVMYPEFAKDAKEEGFTEISQIFLAVAKAEMQHEKNYRTLRKNVLEKRVFEKDKVVRWRCRNCGYVHEESQAPDKCPACAHPQAYFELLAENY